MTKQLLCAVFFCGLVNAASATGIAEEANSANAAAAVKEASGTFTVFDVPGASCSGGDGICTEVVGVDSAGDVAGHYFDASGITHSFFRLADGNIYTFDAPGATCLGTTGCTYATAMGPNGDIIGTYPNGLYEDGPVIAGFVRDSRGKFTALQAAPNAVDTDPISINAAGEITGYYGSIYGEHAFVRDAEGNYKSFDAPGPVYGTYPSSINFGGDIVGTYSDGTNTVYTFVLCRTGEFIDMGFSYQGDPDSFTSPSIDDVGQVVGAYYVPLSGGDLGSYFRNTHGAYTTFSVPGAPQTIAVATNNNGTAVGYWYTGSGGGQRGFFRQPDGTITAFGPNTTAVTRPTAINAGGTVSGNYTDESHLAHGFIWKSN